MNLGRQLLFAASLLGVCPAVHAQSQEVPASEGTPSVGPQIHHANIARVTLFAEHPDIVTPVGIAVAPDGRVFVQENHTHKRTADYTGPETDRILVFEDEDQDGVADQRSVFFAGHTFSTDLLFGPDGHLYVSTRWFIARFREAGKQQRAQGEPEKIVICETEGEYPHNGVGGLAIDARPDWLAFGFGENLGFDYTFVGADGVRLSGGAEGGSTYQCRTDGSELTRQSTGHWNAFGMAFDLSGNLFSTDNDPNATPPNRLLHIVPGADFGYEYRYGRSGRHPLVCWYGEHPGTLGMIGALGEAACGIVPHGPQRLLSASWTDNRVDLHTLVPQGASFIAHRVPFLSGSDDFRPVHFAYSPDGRYLYFTDWVKISYPVHGHGRIWRVEFHQPVRQAPLPRERTTKSLSPETALSQLGSSDPYVRTRAVHLLAQHPQSLTAFPWRDLRSGLARAHYAVALKRADPAEYAGVIPQLLLDDDPQVRFVGIKWIADEGLAHFRADVEGVLQRPDLSRRDLRAALAALAAITTKDGQEFSPDRKLWELAQDTSKPPTLRALALRNIRGDFADVTVDRLQQLAGERLATLLPEVVRSLALHPDPKKATALAALASDPALDDQLRADAIAGLADAADAHRQQLMQLAEETNPILSREAKRTLVSAGLRQRHVEIKPAPEDIEAWESLVARAAGEPDVHVGRRLFFHAKLGGCYKCHGMDGRGHAIGPDLTAIHRQSEVTRARLLRHIVSPSAEMAPYYRPQQLVTTDGRSHIGLVIGKEGQQQAYVGADGALFFLDKNDVETRRELNQSIMPNGLLDELSVSEIRDLLAYLLREGG